MKTQWIAWMASGLTISGSVFPTVVRADDNSLAQLFPALVGVQLTSAQQTQLEDLSEQILPQVQNLLSPGQRVQFNTALSQGKGVRVALLSLDLSVGQRQQILKLLQPMRSQLAIILTPEQQQQIRQNVRALQQQNY